MKFVGGLDWRKEKDLAAHQLVQRLGVPRHEDDPVDREAPLSRPASVPVGLGAQPGFHAGEGGLVQGRDQTAVPMQSGWR